MKTKYINIATIGFLIPIVLSSCGNSAVNGQAIGQAKGWDNATPLICPDYKFFDMSQGVMQGGSGSVSKEDMYFTIADYVDMRIVENAVKTGAIVKVKYNQRRAPFCTELYILTGIEIISKVEGN